MKENNNVMWNETSDIIRGVAREIHKKIKTVAVTN